MAAHTAGRLLVLFVGLPIILAGTRAHAACVDPAELARSTVSILRHFDEAERDARPDLIGIQGTGWFLSPTAIVTIAHVTEAMKLSTQDWKPLEIADRHGSQFIAARVQRLAGDRAEKLAVHRAATSRFRHAPPQDSRGTAGGGRTDHDPGLPGRLPAFRPRPVRSIRRRREARGHCAAGDA
jgi:hypothetical protein